MEYQSLIKSRQDKGHVALVTTHGQFQFEILCNKAPKTAENFLELCERHYYDNCIFHRLIKGFMIQGGDPTGTGTGGQSYFGEPFEDECRQEEKRVSHTERGLLSMANKGPNTNGSQFFITFGDCQHLDGKHTVFGRLVSGFDALDLLEQLPTDEKKRPTEEVKILKTIVVQNPFRSTIAEILLKDWKILSQEHQAELELSQKVNLLKRQKVSNSD